MSAYINPTLTVKDLFRRWLDVQNYPNQDLYISNHNLEGCREWIHTTYRRTHNTATIERAFRDMREKGEIEAKAAYLPGNKEKRWLIQST